MRKKFAWSSRPVDVISRRGTAGADPKARLPCVQATVLPASVREPLIAIRRHELVVIQMRVGLTDTIDFFALAGAQCLLRVKTPGPGEQSLASQHLVDTRNATGEMV